MLQSFLSSFAFLQSIASDQGVRSGSDHQQPFDVYPCCPILVLGGGLLRKRLFAAKAALSSKLLGFAPGVLCFLGADQYGDNGAGL